MFLSTDDDYGEKHMDKFLVSTFNGKDMDEMMRWLKNLKNSAGVCENELILTVC